MPSESAAVLAEELLQLSEMLTPMIEAATGCKAQLEAAGWSSGTAETMALEQFRMMMTLVKDAVLTALTD